MGRLLGKVVIVTGASSGIGEATAIDFAKERAKLMIAGRNKDRLSATAEKCKNAGAEVHEFVGDLIEFENLELLINETVKHYGGIDILINNAGFADAKPIADVDVNVYDNLFKTNLRAPVFLSCIVNVSSCAGLDLSFCCIPYSMTKCALDHFTRGFSAECAPYGVRVNSVNPAVVITGIGESSGHSAEAYKALLEKLLKRHPLGFIDAHQVAESILFLCTSEMITGIALPIDGGYLHSDHMQ